MNRRFLIRVTTLIAMLGLAVTSLLLLFLLLGQNTVGATPGENVTITDLNADLCVCSGVWVSETVDSAEGGFHSTSLALEPTYPYTPHISYIDASTYPNRLKYAWLSGITWLIETVESGFGSTSLALVPTYPHTPCILYRGETDQTIKFAYLSGTTWISEIIQGGYGAEKPTSLALKPAYPYNPHVSHYMPFGAYDLRHIYLSGTAWMSGTWVHEIVDDSQVGGGYSSIALESTYPYTPHISYSMGGLKHAWLSGTTWLSETVDSMDSVWVKTSLVLDSSGNPRIGYYDHSNRDLMYARLSGTTWATETVDSEGDVGDWLSLALDSRDNPHISYYDRTHSDLKLASFEGGGWIIQTVDSEGDVGGWPSLALDQADCPHISYHDGTNCDLKYAYVPTVPAADFTAWPTTGLASLMVVFTNTSTCGYTTSSWDFGDEVTSPLSNPTHVYTKPGVYTVALTVSGPGGTDTLTRTNYITVEPSADVAIVKSSRPHTLTFGDWLAYTLVYSNNGPYEAANVVITDVVPITLTNVSATSSGAQITPTGSVSYTWLVEDLSPGEGGVITITAQFSPSLRTCVTFTNSARIATDVLDPDQINNDSSASNTVVYRIYLPVIFKSY